MINPVTLLREATKRVPALKYGFAVAGIAAVIAIIQGLRINNAKIPIGTILLILALMVLVYVFSVLVTRKSAQVRKAGVILLYSVIIFAVASGALLLTSIFFDFPKKIGEYGIFKEDSNKKDTTNDDSQPVNTSLNIKGRVYAVENGEPLQNLLVIPSFFKPNQVTDERGAFEFHEIQPDQAVDSSKLSFKHNGIFLTNINVPKEKYGTWIDCRVSLDPNANLVTLKRRFPGSYVLVKLPKDRINTDTMNNLLNPFAELVESSRQHAVYNADAYRHDKQMLDLITENDNLIPARLRKSFDSIYQHLFILTSSYEKAKSKGVTLKVDTIAHSFPKKNYQKVILYKRNQ